MFDKQNEPEHLFETSCDIKESDSPIVVSISDQYGKKSTPFARICIVYSFLLFFKQCVAVSLRRIISIFVFVHCCWKLYRKVRMGLLLNHTLLFMLSSVEIPEQPKLVSATENSITLSFNKPDDKQIFIYCDKFKNVFSQTTSTHSI